ncbi:uncharacterized protein AMSG_12168 [Thecamonas trahens ATCC 50062]|uniref:Carboxypeptidase Q n=1 Tax=Thecamonas trahens ATCC 50062 TaxID=461836 RepID=A0A0L0DKQ4_THETB|nr:hypothetical protein AMSG_12168 [Thecamonas trahens ATCC 50062]KNC52616.1 hypothetical protein AMSG_12168 [Thecamonas trahens ATCC 50062]|eukprot:XP_013755244.1 hypothetical protein AMSG_12168 [Thecamonas trahens ATCC 50062]
MAVYFCQAISDACASLGDGCEKCIETICPQDRPFPIFLSYAWCLNLVPAVAGLITAFTGSGACDSNLQTFCIVQFFVCGLHLMFASYGYWRVAYPRPDEEGKSIASLACHMAMYDPFVCLYAFVWVGALVWTIVGSGYVSSANAKCEDETIYKVASVLVIVSYMYLFGGFLVIFMSIFCDCCRDERKPRDSSRSRRDAESASHSRSRGQVSESSRVSSSTSAAGGGGGGVFSGVRSMFGGGGGHSASSTSTSRSTASGAPPAYQPAAATPYQQSAAAGNSGGYRQAAAGGCPQVSRSQGGLLMLLVVLVVTGGVVAAVVSTRGKDNNQPRHVPDPATTHIIHSALNASLGYQRLVFMCDTFGHRLSGSQALEDAIVWIEDNMRSDGLDRVVREPVNVTHWVRGEESLHLLQPALIAGPMAMLGLGGSGPTPVAGIKAGITVVESLAAARAMPDNAANGTFLLLNQRFTTYGETSPVRREGPKEAARLGAVAALVRSVTPFSLNTPHTGSMAPAAVPGAAITVEDAELLARLAAAGETIELELAMEAHTLPDKALSYNVMGEMTGTEFPDQVVVLGGHIDSWDVGTGALDDGGGILAAWDALRVIKTLGLAPRRTIRVVAWTNEENGAAGAAQYARDHAHEMESLSFALESDSGIFTPKGFGFTGSDAAFAKLSAIIDAINADAAASDDDDDPAARLELAMTRGGGGVDIQPLIDAGVPGAGLLVGKGYPDSYYFYFHHTDADTSDKIAPGEFQECVAAMAALVWEIANLDELLPRT